MTKIILAIATALCLTQAVQASDSILITPVSNQEQKSVSTQDYGSHWFGRVMTNTRSVARFTITNTGAEPLIFISSNMWGMFFDAYHNCRGTLLPGQRCQLEIAYWPSFEGHHNGDFDMQFQQDSVHIRVWGEAVRRF